MILYCRGFVKSINFLFSMLPIGGGFSVYLDVLFFILDEYVGECLLRRVTCIIIVEGQTC